MKRTIILTENDIKNIIHDCILEYYTHNSAEEGKTANVLTALGLAASGMAGLGYTNTQNNQQPNITAPQAMFTVNNNTDNDSTISYYDYLKNKLTKRNNPQKRQVANNLPKQEKAEIKKEYFPSDNLIKFIKAYETFHDGWINDGSGNLTTGWGFKITPELKKRFPNGMHRDKNGNTPEADGYLIEYINKHLDEFRKSTPNLDKLPQEYADALFDVFYNVGGKVYRNSPKLQTALQNMDFEQIANNLKYGKLKGHKKRSADRKNILNGIYQRT